MLGDMLEKGSGVPVSLHEAAYHYRLAALDGSMEALIRLCDLYMGNKGFTRDCDRAIYWLGLLISKGNKFAVMDMADALLNKGDYEPAIKLLKELESSEPNERRAFACERLSRCYQNGWGVKTNAKTADKYLKKAVEKGNRDALYTMACRLLDQGNTTEGIALLKKSCQGGLSGAIYKLGTLYQQGILVPKNEKSAYKYIKTAADAGHPEAMLQLINATVQKQALAPTLDEAMHYAELIDSSSDPRAAALLEQLMNMRGS